MPIDIEPTVKTDNRNPDLILNAVDLSHLERLFDGLMKRHPMLTDRFLEEIGRAGRHLLGVPQGCRRYR